MPASAADMEHRYRTRSSVPREVWVITRRGWAVVRTDLPPITVLVTLRNDARYLSRCLDSIFQQHYPPALVEVLVVDCGSTDGSREIISLYRHLHPNLRLLVNPAGEPDHGFRRALQEAKGDIIVPLQGRMRLPPTYLRQCVATMRATGAPAVGITVQAVGDSPIAETLAAVLNHPLGGGLTVCWPLASHGGPPFTSFLVAWQKAAFPLPAETRFPLPWLAASPLIPRRPPQKRIAWIPDARVQMAAPNALRRVAQEQIHAGYVVGQHVKRTGKTMPLQAAVIPLLVLIFWGLWLLGWHVPWAARVAATLLWGYLVGTSALALNIIRKNHRRQWWRAWVALWIVHWAWGMGFWAGLLTPTTKASPPSRRGGPL